MPFVWLGLLLVIAKYMEFGLFAQLSWWWVLAPLAVAFAWFEIFEPMFGLDKRKEDKSTELAKKARIKQAFEKKKA